MSQLSVDQSEQIGTPLGTGEDMMCIVGSAEGQDDLGATNRYLQENPQNKIKKARSGVPWRTFKQYILFVNSSYGHARHIIQKLTTLCVSYLRAGASY